MNEVKLIHGDCLEKMKDIPDKSIDAIICDLPYGTTSNKWDVVIPFDKLWEQYDRIVKSGGVIALFGSEPFCTNLRISNFKNFKYDWIWEKSRPSGINFQTQPMKKHEIISIFCNEKIKIFNPIMELKEYKGSVSNRKPWNTWNTGKSNHIKGETKKKLCNSMRKPTSILKFPSVSNYPKNLHPTQKPVPLLEYLIKTYSNEGDTILDNCMGSGSTMVACLNTKRNGIGIELNDEYFAIAEKRVKETKQQLKLF